MDLYPLISDLNLPTISGETLLLVLVLLALVVLALVAWRYRPRRQP